MSRSKLSKHFRDYFGRMAEIGIHNHDNLILGSLQSFDDRDTQSTQSAARDEVRPAGSTSRKRFCGAISALVIQWKSLDV